MNDDNDKKTPWFEPKRMGYDVGPRSWQGWLVNLLGVVIALTTVTLAHDQRPNWFKAKTNGVGFNPATWEGWVATLIPLAIIFLIVLPIYFKQRKG